MNPTPSLGRIVRYVLGPERVRPAIVVDVIAGEFVDLQVFLDGPNDDAFLTDLERLALSDDPKRVCATALWRSNVAHVEPSGGGPSPTGTWHWPPKT